MNYGTFGFPKKQYTFGADVDPDQGTLSLTATSAINKGDIVTTYDSFVDSLPVNATEVTVPETLFVNASQMTLGTNVTAGGAGMCTLSNGNFVVVIPDASGYPAFTIYDSNRNVVTGPTVVAATTMSGAGANSIACCGLVGGGFVVMYKAVTTNNTFFVIYENTGTVRTASTASATSISGGLFMTELTGGGFAVAFSGSTSQAYYAVYSSTGTTVLAPAAVTGATLTSDYGVTIVKRTGGGFFIFDQANTSGYATYVTGYTASGTVQIARTQVNGNSPQAMGSIAATLTSVGILLVGTIDTNSYLLTSVLFTDGTTSISRAGGVSLVDQNTTCLVAQTGVVGGGYVCSISIVTNSYDEVFVIWNVGASSSTYYVKLSEAGYPLHVRNQLSSVGASYTKVCAVAYGTNVSYLITQSTKVTLDTAVQYSSTTFVNNSYSHSSGLQNTANVNSGLTYTGSDTGIGSKLYNSGNGYVYVSKKRSGTPYDLCIVGQLLNKSGNVISKRVGMRTSYPDASTGDASKFDLCRLSDGRYMSVNLTNNKLFLMITIYDSSLKYVSSNSIILSVPAQTATQTYTGHNVSICATNDGGAVVLYEATNFSLVKVSSSGSVVWGPIATSQGSLATTTPGYLNYIEELSTGDLITVMGTSNTTSSIQTYTKTGSYVFGGLSSGSIAVKTLSDSNVLVYSADSVAASSQISLYDRTGQTVIKTVSLTAAPGNYTTNHYTVVEAMNGYFVIYNNNTGSTQVFYNDLTPITSFTTGTHWQIKSNNPNEFLIAKDSNTVLKYSVFDRNIIGVATNSVPANGDVIVRRRGKNNEDISMKLNTTWSTKIYKFDDVSNGGGAGSIQGNYITLNNNAGTRRNIN